MLNSLAVAREAELWEAAVPTQIRRMIRDAQSCREPPVQYGSGSDRLILR